MRKDSGKAKFDRWPNVMPVLMDMADTVSIEKGLPTSTACWPASCCKLSVINAAAISIPDAIELAPIQEAEDTMNTHVVGGMRVLQAAFAVKPKPRYRVGMDSKVVCLLADLLPARWMDFVMGQSL